MTVAGAIFVETGDCMLSSTSNVYVAFLVANLHGLI